jgi:hypothetical protein
MLKELTRNTKIPKGQNNLGNRNIKAYIIEPETTTNENMDQYKSNKSMQRRGKSSGRQYNNSSYNFEESVEKNKNPQSYNSKEYSYVTEKTLDTTSHMQKKVMKPYNDDYLTSIKNELVNSASAYNLDNKTKSRPKSIKNTRNTTNKSYNGSYLSPNSINVSGSLNTNKLSESFTVENMNFQRNSKYFFILIKLFFNS